MIGRRVALALGTALAVGLSPALGGCAAFTDDAGPAVRPDGTVEVAAAFYPLQFVAERVGGPQVDVIGLTRPGGEPHDLELDPRQTADVLDAGLVVYERGLQASVDAAVDQRTDASATLDVVPTARLEQRDGQPDPHFWLDPLRLADVADAVAAELATIDPTHAADYRERAAGLRRELEALDRSFTAGLADCARSTIVVSHEAFGYWERYGLTVEPIAGLSPDAEPTPADLARLQDLVRSDGITTVFGEALASPRLTRTLAEDAGVRTAVLDPIEGLSDATSGEDYLTLMRADLRAVEEANGCR